jgi:hypothetical protein
VEANKRAPAELSNGWLARPRPESEHVGDSRLDQVSVGDGADAEDRASSELSALSQHRRTRIPQSTGRIPAVLWAVIIGGILTVLSACLFGSTNMPLHSLQVFAFSFLIALGLVSIGDINRPFQRWVQVSAFAFEGAQQSMQLP